MPGAVLITGGAGFIGSHFVPYFCAKYPGRNVVTLDRLTYAGDARNLEECAAFANHSFVRGDICDGELLERLFAEHDFTGVIHFAAESHVDNSIAAPREFIRTNITGTFELLEAARKHWLRAPGECRPGHGDSRFHHISTDEVYGSLGAEGMFSETSPYAPNSPYSASKAGSDFLVRAYHHTYGLNATTSNCSNNYGPKQHREKLIPTILRAALAEQPIPLYGAGANVRDWLYVLDHCKAVDAIFHRGKTGATYTIGGNAEMSNLAVAQTICTILDKLRPRPAGKKYEALITFVEDRPGHDARYAIDSGKIRAELGWSPEESFVSGIEKTVKWYL